MPKAKKKWFIIKAGSAQVYSHPDFNSSCITEAIYGESCRILRHKDNWFKIECEDGYIGWVNSFFGIRSLERNKPKYLVVYPNDGGCFISKYPFGSQMENYIPGSMLINKKLGSDKVIDVATHLVGIPYKWGGKSSLGFDCSGLLQSILTMAKIKNFPRDTSQQIISNALSEKNNKPKLGDVIFFKSQNIVDHVGLYVNEEEFIHCSGFVKINSIIKKNQYYSNKLKSTFFKVYKINVDVS